MFIFAPNSSPGKTEDNGPTTGVPFKVCAAMKASATGI